MTAATIYAVLFGVGALAVLGAQPHGAPTVSFADRLLSLQPDVRRIQTSPRQRVFRTAMFEEILRPAIERAGSIARRISERLGLSPRTTEQRLRITGDRGGLTLFLGQKVASGIVGLSLFPTAASFGVGPAVPLAFWLAGGVAGFLMPDVVLRSRAQLAQRHMREELVQLGEMLTLAVSAGMGLENALEQVSAHREGRLFAEVRRLLRDAQIAGESAPVALSRLAGEIGLPEAEPLTTAVRTAATQGAPITQALRAQARALRERRRLELVEAGERAQIRMLLPVGLLILPAFFVLVLYPAAVQLLQVTGL